MIRSLCRAGAAIGRTTLVSLAALAAVSAHEIGIVYIGEADSAAAHGVRQGFAEAATQGEFLGIKYHLVFADVGETLDGSPVALIVSANPTRLLQIAERHPDVPVFNTTAGDTILREFCRDNLFHIGPSDAMLEDAERQWQRKVPGSAAGARAWHRTFRKYASAQLNSRFLARFGQAMDDDAWAGWAAMKLLSDTIARQTTLSGSLLIEELKTNLAFDGQKGMGMSFRETGQLRQPLLLVDGDKIVGEAPVRGVVGTTNLDSLGLPYCPK